MIGGAEGQGNAGRAPSQAQENPKDVPDQQHRPGPHGTPPIYETPFRDRAYRLTQNRAPSLEATLRRSDHDVRADAPDCRRDRQDDHEVGGTTIEDVVGNDEHRPPPGLLVPRVGSRSASHISPRPGLFTGALDASRPAPPWTGAWRAARRPPSRPRPCAPPAPWTRRAGRPAARQTRR